MYRYDTIFRTVKAHFVTAVHYVTTHAFRNKISTHFVKMRIVKNKNVFFSEDFVACVPYRALFITIVLKGPSKGCVKGTT